MRSTARINIVGDAGVVLRSTDSGTNYTQIGPGGTANYTSAHARANNIMVLVGDGGVTYRTTDAGVTWSNQNAALNVNAVDFYSGAGGISVGNLGTINKTTNSGVVWSARTSGTSENLNGVFCFDANTYWAVGNNGTIVNSIDGGATFAAFASSTALTIGYNSTAASTTNISTGAVANANLTLTTWSLTKVGIVITNNTISLYGN